MGAIAALIAAVPRYAELLRSQYWSTDVRDAYVHARLSETLRAAEAIPHYRERFGAAPRADDLTRLPVLRRREVPVLAASIATGRTIDHPFREASSGSTGMPVEFFFDRAHQSGRYAARIRYLFANGWNPARRNAWIVSLTSADPRSADARLLRFFRSLGTQFLRVFDPFDSQVAALRELDPYVVYTMPSNLQGLLDVFEREGRSLPSLRRLFSGGEVLEPSLRERARRVLGVEIADNYGSTEACIAWQCPENGYHVNAEHVLVEVVDENGRAVGAGEMGRVLVTTLENRLMPLVRYEIGDYARLGAAGCVCGRTLPLLGEVVGRGINLFRSRERGRVSPWPLVRFLRARPELRQFQLVQNALDRFTVRYVADAPIDREAAAEIELGISEQMSGEATIVFERLPQIPRTAGGKFMTALYEGN